MLVRRTDPVPIECVVRGYISGSGWKDYQRTGAICGIPLPAGLRESDPLARADLHAVDEGHHRATTKIFPSRRPSRELGVRSPSDCGTPASRSIAAPPNTRGPRHHHRRHEIRIWPARGRSHLDRRSAHARFLALLARGAVFARQAPSLRLTSNTCATISSRSAGTSSPPPLPFRRMWWQATRDKYRESYQRITGHALD